MIKIPETRDVWSQAEMDALRLSGFKGYINVHGGSQEYPVCVDDWTRYPVFALGDAHVLAVGRARVRAKDRIRVYAFDRSHVVGYDNAHIEAAPGTTVIITDNATAAALKGHADLTMFGRSLARIDGRQEAAARGDSTVYGYGNSHARLFDSATAVLHEKAVGTRYSVDATVRRVEEQ